MAAYAALASLMNNIDQIINHPSLSTSLDNINQTRLLMEKARLLLDFIEGYDYGVVLSKEVEDLERRITSAAYAAEDVIESQIVDHILAAAPADVIESHIVDQNLSPSADDGKTSHRFLLKVRNKIRDLKRRMAACMARAVEDVIEYRTADLVQITEDMDAILKRANELKEEEGLRMREEEQPTLTHSTPLTEIEGSAMVGFEEELIQLMDELTSQRTSRHVISIVGMGGMGKSTLAHNLYYNSFIKQHFDIRAWATVSQQYNAKEILSQFLFGEGNSSRGSSVGELGEQLHKTLFGRRYLIVLDDLWSVEAWDEVSRYFPDDGTRSRVFLTTRLSNVASVCGTSCFAMKPLDDDMNWKLFCKKAFEQESCPYPKLEKVGKEIARLCRGLPLSTVVIGGLLLKSPRSLQLWEKVAFNIKSSPHSKEKEESLNILSLSYNHLPPHLKPCFLYMGVFEEDSRIRVSKLIKLWIAEGFLRPNNTQILEEIAEGYLEGHDTSIEYMHNLECLNKLESLKLNLYQTSNLYLNEIVKFPISLNKLFLIGCLLADEDMSMIGSLPNLQILQVRSLTFKWPRLWSPNEGQFLRLKHLEIDFSNLKIWEADDSHFPVLEKLALSRLWWLNEIPLGIGDIPTLELITVHRCSESAAVSAVRIKEDQLYNQGNEDLQVQVTIEEKQVESITEKVRIEGMAMDGIELDIIPYSERYHEEALSCQAMKELYAMHDNTIKISGLLRVVLDLLDLLGGS